jgi:hypothetical protein
LPSTCAARSATASTLSSPARKALASTIANMVQKAAERPNESYLACADLRVAQRKSTRDEIARSTQFPGVSPERPDGTRGFDHDQAWSARRRRHHSRRLRLLRQFRERYAAIR